MYPWAWAPSPSPFPSASNVPRSAPGLFLAQGPLPLPRPPPGWSPLNALPSSWVPPPSPPLPGWVAPGGLHLGPSCDQGFRLCLAWGGRSPRGLLASSLPPPRCPLLPFRLPGFFFLVFEGVFWGWVLVFLSARCRPGPAGGYMVDYDHLCIRSPFGSSSCLSRRWSCRKRCAASSRLCSYVSFRSCSSRSR